MNEEQIRLEILKIQDKYYTPNSKIACASGVDRSQLSKMMNKSFGKEMYKSVLEKLNKWLEERMI